jgi:hypothetical protein
MKNISSILVGSSSKSFSVSVLLLLRLQHNDFLHAKTDSTEVMIISKPKRTSAVGTDMETANIILSVSGSGVCTVPLEVGCMIAVPTTRMEYYHKDICTYDSKQMHLQHSVYHMMITINKSN